MSTVLTFVKELQIEHLRETLGIGAARPRISWKIETSVQNWMQSAYEIECYHSDGALYGQTGRIESDQSVLVDWPFEGLPSRTAVSLRVRVWGTDGSASEWSEPLTLETGLLQTNDWSAQFITPEWDEDTNQSNPSPYLRREFTISSQVKSARLYITALGLYEAQINGEVVGDHVLAPGWTVYDQRLRYQTFDVTELLHEGQNAIGAILGDGWYRGRLGFEGGKSNIWGEKLALLAQLEIQYEDGSSERFISDENWQATTGAILMNSIYDGETYDARLEMDGWSDAGYDMSAWLGVRALDWDVNTLSAPVSPPVRRTETLQPIAITQSPSGKTLVDFGQNLVGWVRISVQGNAGQTITLRHAEVLEHGELGTRPLRLAKATDQYTLKGNGIEIWEPRFTFHGFRYVEVEGWPGELTPENITAVVVHTDMERIGWFECSDPLLNQLHENVVWGMRGNFVDVPTDCPQRDERLGWTGDLQVFSPTASFLYDASGFLQSWLTDLAIEQSKGSGAVPFVAPNALGEVLGAAAWGDAATVVPSVIYQRYGDTGILEQQYESMRTWVDYVASKASENRLWDIGFQFGDWLDPTAPPDSPGQARTPKAIVATAYFAHSAELVGRAAEILGRKDNKAYYLELAKEIRAAFAAEYITPSGRMVSQAETAYALAIEFDLLTSDEQRQHAGDLLAELVRESGYHIRTGFVGTPLLCDALCHTGHHAAAYRLLMQQENPSWLYPVTMGATTVWERWDSMLPDGSINPGEMTSFNHYALGAVADWMHRTIGGLAPAAPGYRRLEFQPQPGGGLTHTRVRHITPYGLAECAWEFTDGQLAVNVTVPPNTTAQVTLPNGEMAEIGSGTWNWTMAYDLPAFQTNYTVDDVIGDILSDSATKGAVFGTMARMEAPGFFFAVLEGEPNVTLRQALQMLPGGDRFIEAVAEALTEQSS